MGVLRIAKEKLDSNVIKKDLAVLLFAEMG